VLNYPKFKLSSADREELLADYLPFCATINMPPKPPHVPTCRDPLDLPFLELAAYEKVDYLVTGDLDLLAIREKVTFAITTAEQFLDSVAAAK